MNRSLAYLSEDGSLITADSIPDLDGWGWDTYWGCNQWVQWHKANRQKYGLQQANDKFVRFWNQQGFGAHALGCRTIDSPFRKYVRRVGLWEAVWEGAEGLKLILQPAGQILQTGGAVGQGIGQGLEVTSQALKYIIPIVASGIILAGGMYLFRRVTKSKF